MIPGDRTPPPLTVYHGTAFNFKTHIEDNGLRPPPRHGAGVRVRLRTLEAWEDARAWAAYIMLREQLPPKGILAIARIARHRIKEVRGVLRVELGLLAREIHFEERDFPELFDEARADEALARWEGMTSNRLNIVGRRRGARRS